MRSKVFSLIPSSIHCTSRKMHPAAMRRASHGSAQAPDDGLSTSSQGGSRRPFDTENPNCQAPCPPGGFCNTECCSRRTEFWVQKWTCLWTRTELQCGRGDAPSDLCAWTKAWRCRFLQIERGDVLAFFPSRPHARCPLPAADYSGENECFVPEDAYFAKVYEIEYQSCGEEQHSPPGTTTRGHDDQGSRCSRSGSSDVGTPTDCACCGLYETCRPRWLRIYSRAQIPPLYPYAVPPPFYDSRAEEPLRRQWCAPKSPACSGGMDRIGSGSAAFCRAPPLPF